MRKSRNGAADVKVAQGALPGFEHPVPRERALCIREMPTTYQPRERLKQEGAAALSTGELLDIVTGARKVGEAQRLLAYFGSLRRMARASLTEFAGAGLGPATTVRVKAALELSRRAIVEEARPERISSPTDAAHLLMPLIGDQEQEHFVLLLLDRRNKLIVAPITLYVGTVGAISIRVADMLREAVRHNCSALITGHNHPSGDPTPSPEDIATAKKISRACQMIDVESLDHLVVGRCRWVSLKERGLLG